MSWRSDRRRKMVLLALAILAVGLQGVMELTRRPVRQSDYELKMEAARLAKRAFESVKKHRGMEDAQLDLTNDPSGTGLIGPETSLITNSYGNLESKLTSLNPNFAAYVVEELRKARLKDGDPIAIAISGSFPGMNIAVYAAIEVMGLRPVIVTSVGASNWGATNPDFTWLDMEKLFYNKKLFGFRSVAASYGGGDDMGRGLSPRGRELIAETAARNQLPLLSSANLEEAITRRMTFYESEGRGRAYKAYVNVGGGLASLGSSQNRNLLPAGLSFELEPSNWPRKGCLILMSEKGIPVLQLLNLSILANLAGLPYAPEEMPEPGSGNVFMKDSYRLDLALLFFVLYALVCTLVLAPEARRGLFERWRGKVDGDTV